MKRFLLLALIGASLIGCTQSKYTDAAIGDDIQGPVLRYSIFVYDDGSYDWKYNMHFDTTGVLLEDNHFYYDRVFRNDDGEIYSQSSYERDSKGRIVKGTCEEEYPAYMTYVYDREDRVVEEIYERTSDQYKSVIRNHYAADGHVDYRIETRTGGDDMGQTQIDSLVYTLKQIDHRGNWTVREAKAYATRIATSSDMVETTTSEFERVEYRFIQYYDEPDPLFSDILETEPRTYSHYYCNEYQGIYTQLNIEMDYPVSLKKGDLGKLETCIARTLLPYADGTTIEERMDNFYTFGTPIEALPEGFNGKLDKCNLSLILSHQNGDLITYFINDMSSAHDYTRYVPHYLNFDTRNNELVHFGDLISDDHKYEVGQEIKEAAENSGLSNVNGYEILEGDFYFNAGSICVFHSKQALRGTDVDMVQYMLQLSNRGRRFLAPYLVRYHERPMDGESFIPYGAHMDTRSFSLFQGDKQVFVKMPYDGSIVVEIHEASYKMPIEERWTGSVTLLDETYGDGQPIYQCHLQQRDVYKNGSLSQARSCDCYCRFSIAQDGKFVLISVRDDHRGNHFDFGGMEMGKTYSAGEDGTVG